MRRSIVGFACVAVLISVTGVNGAGPRGYDELVNVIEHGNAYQRAQAIWQLVRDQ